MCKAVSVDLFSVLSSFSICFLSFCLSVSLHSVCLSLCIDHYKHSTTTIFCLSACPSVCQFTCLLVFQYFSVFSAFSSFVSFSLSGLSGVFNLSLCCCQCQSVSLSALFSVFHSDLLDFSDFSVCHSFLSIYLTVSLSSLSKILFTSLSVYFQSISRSDFSSLSILKYLRLQSISPSISQPTSKSVS